MSRIDPQQGLQPSILDRLIDPDAKGTGWRRGYGLEDMVNVVRRDLEDLLNTRRSYQGPREAFAEIERSILGYGLPELTSLDAITPQQREEIGRVLEAAVLHFEPRLRDVRATLVDAGDSKQPTVRFRIDARLCVDPAPEVAFETVLELMSGRAAVKEAER
jgi:type VI secretion system protein ImpF